MSVLNVLTRPWAIEQGAFDQLATLIQTHQGRGPGEVEASLAALLAANQRPLAYATRSDGVAVLQVSGVMTPRLTWLSALFGGTSTQDLAAQLNAMAADPKVTSALVVWDSPGGSVSSVPAARDAMRGLAAAKPTASLVQGVMASAAYWVGSAARAVYVEGATDVVGSLGVVQRLNWEPADATSMHLVRGKFKRASINGQPPNAEFIQYIEGQLDYLYSLLIGDVAKQRGVSDEQTHSRMGDGRLFLGRQAIDAGLADGEMGVSEAADMLAKKPKEVRRGNSRAAMGQHSLMHTIDKGVQALSALPPAPPAAAVAPVPVVPWHKTPGLTRADVVANCERRAARDNCTVQEALRKIDPDGTLTAALPAGQRKPPTPMPTNRAEREALAAEARQFAASRRISYPQALKALGY